MTSLVLGVIGHVDHGKTALVRALTGEDTDRLAQEKQRGISITLGFANLKVGSETQIDLIDMPGHERFVRTMIGGATGIDAVLLVVAANEGIKPQTVEHVDIASLLGLRHAVVAITKTDLVAPTQARRVAEQAVQLLRRSGLSALPPAMTSVQPESGIEDLRGSLEALAAVQHMRANDGMTFLPIDRSFSIAGHGPVVTGTLRGAPVKDEDTLELLPLRRLVRVRAIQVHGARVAMAIPGQRVALNLRDVEIAQLKRSMALATPDSLPLGDWLTISVRAVDGAPSLKNGIRLRALLGTGEFDCRLRLLDRDVLQAGQAGFAQLHFIEQVALPAGEHVLLRIPSPPRTVAGGKVLDPGARRERRHRSEILERLEDLRVLSPDAIVAAEVRRVGTAGTTLRHLSQLCALAIPRIVELLHTLPIVITHSGLVVSQAALDGVLSPIPSLLASRGAGLSYERLLSALKTTAPVLDEALRRLRNAGVIIERSGLFLMPRPDADRARATNEAQLAVQIAETLRQAGLSPPNPKEIVTDVQSKRAVDSLLREGVVVRAVDRAKDREMLFHQDAIDEARRRLTPLLQRGSGLLVTEIGAALGISRRHSMPLLDHLDTIHFTCRIKDRRISAEPAADK